MIEQTTHESWLGRLGDSIKGIILGCVVFVAAFPLLFLNEGRAVRTAKGLSEGAGAVRKIDASDIDPANEGRFVHVSGMATTDEVLEDETFGVTIQGIRLARHVEMYQWKEKVETKRQKKIGGGTKTTRRYTYHKVWSPKLISSGEFAQPTGHENPASMVAVPISIHSKSVELGRFRLPVSLIQQIDKPEAVTIREQDLPEAYAQAGQIKADGPNGGSRLYITRPDAARGAETGIPAIGDTRIWYTTTPNTEVSIMSQQVGDSFSPYQTAAGTELNMLVTELATPEKMIAQAERANTTLTWALRGVGLLMMVGGIALVLRPVAVIGDVIPVVGSLVELGTSLVALLIGVGLTFCTVSVAWLFYRPLLGVLLLGIGLTLLVVLIRKLRSKPATAGVGDARSTVYESSLA